METKKKTFAQEAIMKRVEQKRCRIISFQDQIEYDDYNDCHGDYFDAE